VAGDQALENIAEIAERLDANRELGPRTTPYTYTTLTQTWRPGQPSPNPEGARTRQRRRARPRAALIDALGGDSSVNEDQRDLIDLIIDQTFLIRRLRGRERT
jgi:hypothetical protein